MFTLKRQEVITEKLFDFMLKANMPMCLEITNHLFILLKGLLQILLNQDYKLP